MKSIIVKLALIAGLTFISYTIAVKIIEMPVNLATSSISAFTNAIKPTVTIEQRIFNALGEMKKESKLVVLSTTLVVEEELLSHKRFMWNFYDLGTTKVRMIVPGNKVQYYIPTELLDRNSIKWDVVNKEYIINLPDPVLDESIVEVQSDPAKYIIEKEIGWARLNSKSGVNLENQIRSNLRKRVVEMGNNEIYLNKARESAKEVIMKFLQDIQIEERNIALM